ncbi:MAG: hypothetical protein KBD60_13120 [Sterolibacterium sp.]|nr:hypothetical protein [Sterolibacterium sp.]
MNALVIFAFAPAALALLRGRPIFWHSLAGLVVFFTLLQGGSPAVGGVLWLICLVLAALR